MEEVAGKYGKAFHELTDEEKLAVATEKNNYITDPKVKEENLNRGGGWSGKPPFFWSVKELTLVGYFTTEYGATKVLQYVPVPVQWDGCLPLEEAGEGRTWATT